MIMFCLASTAMAQQDALFSQYIFNGLMVNPAYAGSRGTLSATYYLRKQWWGFNGSPFTQNISIHSPIKHARNAIGGSVFYDQIGPTQTISVNANYAYMIPFEDVGTLSFGIQGGFSYFNNNLNNIRLTDQSDQAANVNNYTAILPNVGAGVYFFDEKWYVGFSVPEIITNSLVKKGWADQFQSRQDRIYLLSGGLMFPLNMHLKFRPSVLGRFTPGAPIQFDLNAHLLIRDRVWVGIGYRTQDAIIFNAAVEIADLFRIGYSYDMATTQLFSLQSGSHEFMIGFDLKHKFKQSTPLLHIDSPRYF